MAFQKKYQDLATAGADIMVIQECSRRFVEQVKQWEAWSSAWFGKNPHKGLAVLVKTPWAIREAQTLRPMWAGKVIIDGPTSFELFPVWACRGTTSAEEYIGQVHLLLDLVEQDLLSPFAIVLGDFNSNSIWDGGYGIRNHSAAVDRFSKLGLESAYHVFSGDRQGAERRPTLWFRKNRKAVYHVDYVFLSRQLLARLRNVVIGCCDDWRSLSDHAPVLVELDL